MDWVRDDDTFVADLKLPEYNEGKCPLRMSFGFSSLETLEDASDDEIASSMHSDASEEYYPSCSCSCPSCSSAYVGPSM